MIISSTIQRSKAEDLVQRNPFALKNFVSVLDENNNPVLQECDPVAPSLASEYSVVENSLRGREQSTNYRIPNTDPVDLPEKLDQLNLFE